MYYRIAIQTNNESNWRWKSTVLTSVGALFQLLRLYRTIPQDRMRVFISSSCEDMETMLAQENSGLGSNSVTAAQFVQGSMPYSQKRALGVSEHGILEEQGTASIATDTTPPILYERGMDSLNMRRVELEGGAGGDHNSAYSFTLPTSMPEVLAWVRLLARVQDGTLQP